MSTITQSFILFCLILLSAFFSGIETAFISLSEIRINHLMEQNKRGIRLVKQLKDKHKRLITTILIGNNLVNISASSIATKLAIDLFGSHAIGFAVGLMTLSILVFGEIIPKTIAMNHNESIAIAASPIIRMIQYPLYPMIKLMEWVSWLVAKPFSKTYTDPLITEAEIKTALNLGENIGAIEEEERIMIHNVFRFCDMQADDIMIDRTRMFTVNAQNTLNNVVDDINQKGYSRIPVFDGNADNVIGILYAKDILRAVLPCKDDIPIKQLLRPAMFIPQTMLIDDLLRIFQKEKVHMAIVVDEHGGVSGLITIEDLIEEIVGDIYDETDKEQIMIRKIDSTRSIVKGGTEIEKINEELDMNIDEEEDFETISGYILSHIRRIPKEGEEIQIHNHVFKILKADKKRIMEIEIEKKIDAIEEETKA
ncbi:MAG: HlyC/CorC family transporter [Desulfobacterales bacterium]|nr:HlyC/CorC family transporter [Desulfobacterales bacterium]